MNHVIFSSYTGGLIEGMYCKGRYCDDKRIEMRQRGSRSPFYGSTSNMYTDWFHSENYKECPTGMVVKAILCKGRYCANMKFWCSNLGPGYRTDNDDETGRHVTMRFSEESEQWVGCMDGYFMSGSQCHGSYCDNIKMVCRKVQYDANFNEEFLPPPPDSDLAKKFAPILYFDKNSDQFPMSLEHYWSISETDENGKRVLPDYSPAWNSFDRSKMGISYTVVHCDDRTKIVYHIFYKGQRSCYIWGMGDHEGDWERVTVELTSDYDTIYRVRYNQHSGWFTRGRDYFPNVNEDGGLHPKVYVGRYSNGSYNDDGGVDNFAGCAYWQDIRNVGGSGKILKSWKEGKLESTDADEDWNKFTGSWGRDGFTHPDPWHDNQCNKPTCNGDGGGICVKHCGCQRNFW